jgi:hypothetical protein
MNHKAASRDEGFTLGVASACDLALGYMRMLERHLAGVR